jgi:transcriptional regulator with XRE-family HTH domain
MSRADRIKLALTESGISQKEVAQKCQVSAAAVSLWVTGHTRSPRSDYAFTIAKLTGFAARWLANGEGPQKEAKPAARVENKTTAAGQISAERLEEVLELFTTRMLKGFEDLQESANQQLLWRFEQMLNTTTARAPVERAGAARKPKLGNMRVLKEPTPVRAKAKGQAAKKKPKP